MLLRTIAFSAGLVLAGVVAPVSAASGAGTNDYGGYDIVGTPGAVERPYGSTRGWAVYGAAVDGAFAYCHAENRREDGVAVRLGWDGLQWQLAVPIDARPDWQGTLLIDGAGSGQGYKAGGDFISGTARGGWSIAWIGEAERDGLRRGGEAILGVGKLDFDVSLMGAAAAMLKVQECVNRAGRG